MDLNPLGWWALQRPSWLTVADVPYITRQNPLFVRKIKADGSVLETFRLSRRSQQQHTEGGNFCRLFYRSHIRVLESKKALGTETDCCMPCVTRRSCLAWIEASGE